MATAATTHDDKLQRELAFTPDDLAANRAGTLSEMQHYRLRARRRRSIGIGVMAVLGAAFVATVFIFLGWRNENVILTLVGIGVTLCSAALTGVFARYWLRLSADIRTREVIAASGQLERVVRPVTRRVVNTVIRVGEVEVFVSKEAFEAFAHRADYTLYRLPYTGELLSAEKI